VREALFLGTPVIATDNGMRPEGVRLIPVGDKVGLVEAVKRAAAMPNIERTDPVADRSNINEVIEIYAKLLAEPLGISPPLNV
jgi:glycosyltransferase involved in cell wall biosynthesis